MHLPCVVQHILDSLFAFEDCLQRVKMQLLQILLVIEIVVFFGYGSSGECYKYNNVSFRNSPSFDVSLQMQINLLKSRNKTYTCISKRKT